MRRIALVSVCFAASCGGDGTGPGDGPLQLETARAATARIGSAGGSITTTDGAGRTYLLTIPPLALRDSVDVTLTPVASYELPTGATLVAAAHFAPEGLRLGVPGRLAIVVPGGAPQVAGFGYSGQGDSLHLDLIGRHGDTLFIPVRHFSGAGAAATPDVALLTPGGPISGSIQAFIQLSALSEAGHTTGTYDAPAMSAVLDGWMTSVIIPALQSAATEQALVDAAGLYADWLEVIECGGDACSPVGIALGGAALHLFPDNVRVDVLSTLTSYEPGRQALAAAIDAGVARLRQQCVGAHDVQAAANIVYWLGYAIRTSNVFLLLHSANELTNFCVKVVVDSLTFPDLITGGTPATLRVRAGLSFGGGPIDRADPLLVTVSAGSAAPASASGNTTGGTFSQAFTPDGQAPVFFGIRAALHRGGLDSLAGIGYADTVLTRNLDAHVSLTPTAAILDPGATAQFTASVTGLAGAGVTWSATGGSISGTGNTVTYTAGPTPGTYAITATSVSDATQHATARIDIVGSVTVSVSPASASLIAGGTQQFTAAVTGSADQAVTWTATGGTFTVSGNTVTYSAGTTPGAYTVRATSVASPSASGTAQVYIGFAPGDVYVGTRTWQVWPNPIPTHPAGSMDPFAFILSSSQADWVVCDVGDGLATIYSSFCPLAGPPLTSATPASLTPVTFDVFGRIGTTPRGGCYYSGQGQNVTINGGTVRATRITGVLYCPINGNYEVLYTFDVAFHQAAATTAP